MQEIIYSFIIPHRNSPNLLDRCLNSIPHRDDIQIIVVDDNSDEGKKPVECGRPEVEYIYISKEESKGAGRARNRGLERAKGKWLMFPDCDDYYNVNFLDVLDKYKTSSSVVIYFNFEYRDGNTQEVLPDLPFKKYFELYDGSQELKEEIKFHHNVPWTKMVSHDYINKYNINFEEVPNGNDILFSMLVGYFTNDIIVEKQCLYVYLKNANSILTSKNQPAESYLCKIRHVIKKNQFYYFIGHSEWRIPVCRFIASSVKKCGIILLFKIMIEGICLFIKRKEWIKLATFRRK